MQPLTLHLLARCCSSIGCCPHSTAQHSTVQASAALTAQHRPGLSCRTPPASTSQQPGHVQQPAGLADHRHGTLLLGITMAGTNQPIASVMYPAAMQPVLPAGAHTKLNPGGAKRNRIQQQQAAIMLTADMQTWDAARRPLHPTTSCVKQMLVVHARIGIWVSQLQRHLCSPARTSSQVSTCCSSLRPHDTQLLPSLARHRGPPA